MTTIGQLRTAVLTAYHNGVHPDCQRCPNHQWAKQAELSGALDAYVAAERAEAIAEYVSGIRPGGALPADLNVREVPRAEGTAMSMEPERPTWWVVSRMMAWSSLGLDGPIRAEMAQPSDGCVGFLPVFDTREAAIEFAEDGETVMPIREAT